MENRKDLMNFVANPTVHYIHMVLIVCARHCLKHLCIETSLVVQRLRLHLPMQEVWVPSLVSNRICFLAKKLKHRTETILQQIQ